MSRSLAICKRYLGKVVKIKIDRPIGSVHPRFNKIRYTSNYGYLEGVKAPDGDDLDAYLLKIDKPIKEFKGIAVAVVHRLNDDDDKLIVIPVNEDISDEEIEKSIEFQEKWTKSRHLIIRA